MCGILDWFVDSLWFKRSYQFIKVSELTAARKWELSRRTDNTSDSATFYFIFKNFIGYLWLQMGRRAGEKKMASDCTTESTREYSWKYTWKTQPVARTCDISEWANFLVKKFFPAPNAGNQRDNFLWKMPARVGPLPSQASAGGLFQNDGERAYYFWICNDELARTTVVVKQKARQLLM